MSWKCRLFMVQKMKSFHIVFVKERERERGRIYRERKGVNLNFVNLFSPEQHYVYLKLIILVLYLVSVIKNDYAFPM